MAALVLVSCEAILRYTNPYSVHGAGQELGWMRTNPHDLTKVFTLDPEFGFRPILGGPSYNVYGTLPNHYAIDKVPGVQRVLFVGDSVTARGKIIEALKRMYGEDRFEYWNAGVESFNTVQEVKFYKKVNYTVRPDHVILTFHMNDFETTPVAFLNQDDKLVVYAPNVPLQRINPWLFQNSHLYRLLLGTTVSHTGRREAMAKEVRQSLGELKDLLEQDHIAFTVIVHPLLKPSEQWVSEDMRMRSMILTVLDQLKIRHFDLFDELQSAIRSGVNVQEGTGDHWHPSADVSERFARYLYESGLLAFPDP